MAHRFTGPELRERREMADLTQEQVAVEMGSARTRIAEYEQRAKLRPRWAIRYLEAIDRLTKGKAA